MNYDSDWNQIQLFEKQILRLINLDPLSTSYGSVVWKFVALLAKWMFLM